MANRWSVFSRAWQTVATFISFLLFTICCTLIKSNYRLGKYEKHECWGFFIFYFQLEGGPSPAARRRRLREMLAPLRPPRSAPASGRKSPVFAHRPRPAPVPGGGGPPACPGWVRDRGKQKFTRTRSKPMRKYGHHSRHGEGQAPLPLLPSQSHGMHEVRDTVTSSPLVRSPPEAL